MESLKSGLGVKRRMSRVGKIPDLMVLLICERFNDPTWAMLHLFEKPLGLGIQKKHKLAASGLR